MKTIQVADRKFQLYLSADQIATRVKEMATALRQRLSDDENPLFVGMLSGSFVFAADFMRAFGKPAEIQFVKCSSYQGTQSSGLLKEELSLGDIDLKDRNVIVLEDIIETGLTMQSFVEKLQEKGAKRISIITLFYKPQCNKSTVSPSMSGFSIPDDFIVGYGLDYNQQGRNLADVYSVILE